jgi:SAM-dependent methyltransferase
MGHRQGGGTGLTRLATGTTTGQAGQASRLPASRRRPAGSETTTRPVTTSRRRTTRGAPQQLAAQTATLRRPRPARPATVLDAGAGTGLFPLLLARQGWQVTDVDLSAAMLQILTFKAAPRRPGIDTHQCGRCQPAQAIPSTLSLNAICCGPCPTRAERRQAAALAADGTGGRLALIEEPSGGTGRPLSPRISMKHPGEPRAAVTDAQNMQLCVTRPQANHHRHAARNRRSVID